MNQQPKASTVCLKDIARACGLSVSTVSRALKNSHEVGEVTRRRVQALAVQMGYRPNPMGAGLAQFKRTSASRPIQAALAWLNVWPNPKQLRSDREVDLYWRGALQAAEKFGYRLEEFHVNEQMPLYRLEKILLTRNVCGILVPPIKTLLDWSSFDWSRFSTVRLGSATRGLPPFHMVASAQATDGMLTFDKMRERGYKRIGFAGSENRDVMFGAGYLWTAATALPEHLRIPPLFVREKPSPADRSAFTAWLKKHRVDAIFTDMRCIPDMLRQGGCRIPEDIGVATMSVFDTDIDAGIYQNPEEIGRVATLVVVSLIQDNARGIPPISREILIKGKWIDGNSLPPRTCESATIEEHESRKRTSNRSCRLGAAGLDAPAVAFS